LAHTEFVKRHDRAAVVIMPTFEHKDAAADELGQIRRPIAKRRQRGARRQPDPHRRDTREIAPLHDGVNEMRRANHDTVDRDTRNPGIGG
jgi:hypothetical protein